MKVDLQRSLIHYFRNLEENSNRFKIIENM